ncbi:ornithine cyclodeaminase/mu-crystallin [Methanotorris formicicus]|uniref:Ornithine cyclodeaminase/mu-crystallin n=1 Tax=Methanotorris formicicus Mc-S-70 TaxID=647171 RepID=H1KWC9_9EURY|nr:ornithine cyclodeaminase/mu-crystallin [Methanotorris formicicus]EHP89506.1 ornithine cyclodeaminase/mu-crystallin [Methanotorris formicicus Mc-S-70]
MFETLILKYEDVERLFDIKKILDVVELAFKEKGLGLVEMPVREPIIKGEWVKEGLYINAIGADAQVRESWKLQCC